MRVSLTNWVGDNLKSILLRFTNTPLRGFITGTLITMVLQSSSAITVLTIGFTNAGLLSFPQTIGIILGTNVGTTFTTQLISLDIHDYIPWILFTGIALWLLPRHSLKCTGLALFGFGSILVGIEGMQYIIQPLKQTGLFSNLISVAKENSLIGISIGTLITALIQSSTATTAITMGFMNDQFIPLIVGIAIILGSNIGTCITALLACIGSNRASRQVAASHIILNIFGVIFFYPLIPWLAEVVMILSVHPQSQIAHAQTLFNVISSLAILPFAVPFARLIEKMIK